MVAYMHIEYSTCQLSEESKGGGIPPPLSLLVVTIKCWVEDKTHANITFLVKQGASFKVEIVQT